MSLSSLSMMPGGADLNTAMLRARSAQAEQATNAAASRLDPKNLQAIDKTAKEFEGMFLAEMLSHMFSGIEVDPEFGGGHGEEMFRSLLVSEYGKKIAEGPGLGISAKVREVMIAAQAAQMPAGPDNAE